ncbi:MAG: site-specific integrase [Acidobacteria bacterium]|nr:site-specific integrase [Acidobacteriota bacterium]
MRLSKRHIDKLRYKGSGGHYVWDDDLAGFGVRVNPSGRKSFVVAFRLRGRQRFYTIGRYGEMTPDQARTKAMKTLYGVRQGIDPATGVVGEEAPRILDLAKRYQTEHAEAKKKASTARQDAKTWENYVLPKLGKRRVADIARDDVSKLHHSLRSTPFVANRVLALLSKAFNLTEVWGWRPDRSNPCRHIKRFKEAKRERFLSQAELRRLAEVLRQAEHERTESPFALAMVWLLIYTGCRSSEIRRLRWAEADLQEKCLRLQDSKTGAKVVQLNRQALEILETLERDPNNPFVIQGLKPRSHLSDLNGPWRRIRKAAGIEDVRLHDLRHTYASFGAAAGLSLPVIGSLLGHSQPATTQRYAHLAADPVREAANAIGANLSAAMAR